MDHHMKPMRTAAIGCGKISNIYFTNLIHRCENIQLVSCCSQRMESAMSQAAKYGLKAETLEQILEDPEIELVVILTPAHSHYGLAKKCLAAGKHVYVEKLFTETHQQAEELLALANEKNLKIGVAPDTFLGIPFQTIQKAVADGLIGEITGVSVAHNKCFSRLYETYSFLLEPGADFASDFGPYYVTALLNLLGPVEFVSGFQMISRPRRTFAKNGEPFVVDNANVASMSLKFANGVLGSIFLAGDNVDPEHPIFMIYGTEGTIFGPDMNRFDGKVYYQNTETAKLPERGKVELKLLPGSLEDGRGIGIDEMAEAIWQNREPLASGVKAAHVVEIMEGFKKSSDEGVTYKMKSGFLVR